MSIITLSIAFVNSFFEKTAKKSTLYYNKKVTLVVHNGAYHSGE